MREKGGAFLSPRSSLSFLVPLLAPFFLSRLAADYLLLVSRLPFLLTSYLSSLPNSLTEWLSRSRLLLLPRSPFFFSHQSVYRISFPCCSSCSLLFAMELARTTCSPLSLKPPCVSLTILEEARLLPFSSPMTPPPPFFSPCRGLIDYITKVVLTLPPPIVHFTFLFPPSLASLPPTELSLFQSLFSSLRAPVF